MMYRIIILLLFIAMASACKFSNGPEEPPAPKASYPAFSFSTLHFGETGGITGSQQSYLLDSLGNLYLIQPQQNQKTRLDSIDHETFQNIDATVRDLRLLDEINQGAGNINRFVIVEDTNYRRVYKWKKPGQEVPRLLESLHQLLMQLSAE